MEKKLFGKIRRTDEFQAIKDKILYRKAQVNLLIRPYPKEIGENPIFIFNHIPKCGGSSLNVVLRKWFHFLRDYPPHDLQYPDPLRLIEAQEIYDASALRLDEVKPFQVVAGHYHNHSLSNRYLNKYGYKNLRLITFLRDPLARRVSLYKYAKKKGHKWVNDLSIDHFVLLESNFMARTMECDEKNYKQVLDSYFFIGLTEDFQTSINKLGEKLNRPIPDEIPFVNRTDSFSQKEKLDEQTINTFKEKNKLDYLVYDYANKLLYEN
ncbi:sulfotransferase family 2 domain-containing protein [Algoriphagus sediminis]|uniref:Sulfotransferase family 2 domain-containing protein n=1 Tax=Algoriphagus sediminis TaxID=3057113 RepID=A0ABT7YDW0_9BACT|nr:sulfotransferase family 2 domain-containing protein [Algoriphagus sediminis]MDN3204706.1 sulfotransferase family 2 domain-containing protein [Algoriphagus sediminis]